MLEAATEAEALAAGVQRMRDLVADDKGGRVRRLIALDALIAVGEPVPSGAATLLLVTPRYADMRWIRDAFRDRWPMEAARRRALIAQLRGVLDNPNPSCWFSRRMAAESIAAAGVDVEEI